MIFTKDHPVFVPSSSVNIFFSVYLAIPNIPINSPILLSHNFHILMKYIIAVAIPLFQFIKKCTILMSLFLMPQKKQAIVIVFVNIERGGMSKISS